MATAQLQFIDEVCTVFNNDGDDEFLQLKKAEELAKEIQELQTKREENIKTQIQALTEQCEEKENEMLSNRKPDALLEGLQEQLKHHQAVRDAAKEQLQEVEIREKEEESNRDHLEKMKLANDEKSKKALPSLRHDLNLYNYLSGIRWQYDAPENQVKGYVANGKTVQTFELDRTQNSQFFITNYLWDLMEEDW